VSALETGRAVLERARDAEVTFLGAAIAYYALVSVLPALLLAVAVATAVGGAALAARVTSLTEQLLPAAGQSVLQSALTSASGRVGASVFGVLLLVWSTSSVFRGLDVAFSRIYDRPGGRSLPNEFRNASVVVAGVSVAMVGMLVLGGLLAALPIPVAGRALGFVALFVGLFAAFLPMFLVLPSAPVTVREVLPGTALAAVGWVALQAGFQLYAIAAPAYKLYGVMGGVLLLVTWFYLAALLLLVGGVVNVVLADR